MKQKLEKAMIERDAKKMAAATREIKKAARAEGAGRPRAKKGTATGKVLSGIVSTAARAIPLVGNFLSPILGDLSEKAGDALQGWVTGHGEYEVKQNSLLDSRQIPLEVRNSPDDWTVIRKREYLGNVFSAPVAGDFAVQNFSVNIGLPDTCPWGSGQARGFREYLLSGALVEFESTTSPIATVDSPNLGSCMGAVEYNSSKTTPFLNEDEMENQDHSVSKATSASWVMPIECAREQTVMDNGLWVRSGPLPANQPNQLYDFCVFSVGTKGQQYSSQNLGKLYFVYEAYLRKPTIVQSETVIPSDLFVMALPTRADMFGGVRTNPSFTPCPNNSLRGSISRDDGGRYIFSPDAPAGDYEFRYYAESMAIPAPGATTLTFASSPNVALVTSDEQLGSEPTIPSAFAGLYYAGTLQFVSGSNLLMCGRVRLSGIAAGGWFQIGTGVTPDWTANFGSLLISPVSNQVVFPEAFLLGQPTPPPRVVAYEASMQHHMESFGQIETPADLKYALTQFRRFLAHKKLPSKISDAVKYLPPAMVARAKAMNYGEERQIDVDGIMALAQMVLQRAARDEDPDHTLDIEECHAPLVRRGARQYSAPKKTAGCTFDPDCEDELSLAALKKRVAELEQELSGPP